MLETTRKELAVDHHLGPVLEVILRIVSKVTVVGNDNAYDCDQNNDGAVEVTNDNEYMSGLPLPENPAVTSSAAYDNMLEVVVVTCSLPTITIIFF